MAARTRSGNYIGFICVLGALTRNLNLRRPVTIRVHLQRDKVNDKAAFSPSCCRVRGKHAVVAADKRQSAATDVRPR